MTFKEIYNQEKDRGANFVTTIATITHKSEVTVRQWLYGVQTPDELTKSVIADHLGKEITELFPSKTDTK